MISESVSSLLVSLGGSAAIILVFAKIFEKILIDQVAKRTVARLDQDLEVLKSKQKIALEEFKVKANVSIKERDVFSTISIETYQEFFKQRIETYQSLLNWENEYSKGMNEDFIVEHTHSYGDMYSSAYKGLREILTKNQLYISNDLELAFKKLRDAAAEYLKDADYTDAMNRSTGDECPQEILDIHYNLAKSTSHLMNAILQQISFDIAMIRSRVEIDKA